MNRGSAAFVARPSTPKLLLLLAGSVLFVCLGIWMAGLFGAPPKPGREFIGWLSILFFGACGVVVLRRLFDRSDQIRIDTTGIYYSQWSERPVPWRDIVDIREMAVRRQKFLCLFLSDPRRHRPETLVGKLGGANRALGFGDISITAAGTDKSFAELREAVFENWHSRYRA